MNREEEMRQISLKIEDKQLLIGAHIVEIINLQKRRKALVKAGVFIPYDN